MKNIFLFLCLVMTYEALASATDLRIYKRIDSFQSQVFITPEYQSEIQASSYTDGKENKRFIDDLFRDDSSLLFKLKQQIKSTNCPEIAGADDCGEVEATDLVMTSFARGGWDICGAVYSFFLGFRHSGSGRFFTVSYLISVSEEVEAQTDASGEFTGTLIKTLNLGHITPIETANF